MDTKHTPGPWIARSYLRFDGAICWRVSRDLPAVGVEYMLNRFGLPESFSQGEANAAIAKAAGGVA